MPGDECLTRYTRLVDRMPGFPASVQRILELTEDPNSSARELVATLERDPVLTVRVLKLVNSPWFGLERPVSSVSRALVVAGLNTLRNLAISITAVGMLPARNDAGMDTRRFLEHSLGVATIARRLARLVEVPEGETTDHFVAGLLHDFGKIVLTRHAGEDYRPVLAAAAGGSAPLQAEEARLLGVDHAELGGLLMGHWRLPGILSGAVRYHHSPDRQGEWSLLRDTVFAANQIVRRLDFGDSGNPVVEPFPAGIRERFGADLPELMEALGDLGPELEHVRHFMQSQDERP
ncbi:HDOD domain-containing protein [Thioalkalivibrio sp. ALJ24]|uniref:HDOD domain-containing protein n=1 Tax=Thioalkalivibrio sp. ALJ24 TaxID=545276 RepID=UPI0003767BC9|nr:HDOD domain-containing protein [Thioalkalivibrio sp. ALJ24]